MKRFTKNGQAIVDSLAIVSFLVMIVFLAKGISVWFELTDAVFVIGAYVTCATLLKINKLYGRTDME
jgi:hypothetical protein